MIEFCQRCSVWESSCQVQIFICHGGFGEVLVVTLGDVSSPCHTKTPSVVCGVDGGLNSNHPQMSVRSRRTQS